MCKRNISIEEFETYILSFNSMDVSWKEGSKRCSLRRGVFDIKRDKDTISVFSIVNGEPEIIFDQIKKITMYSLSEFIVIDKDFEYEIFLC